MTTLVIVTFYVAASAANGHALGRALATRHVSALCVNVAIAVLLFITAGSLGYTAVEKVLMIHVPFAIVMLVTFIISKLRMARNGH